MKIHTPRTWLAAMLLGLSALCFVSVTSWLLASPSEEITKAVAASGKTDAKQADANTFLDALSTVLVTVPKKESAPYVAAATKMRPDLKADIQSEAAAVYDAPNDTDAGDRRRRSRHRRKVPICCQCPNPDSCHTLYFSPREAREFLEKHPNCRIGECPPNH
ncbi:MAG TPA: hypothetical protein VGL24_06720 [Chthoniobacterales bacterium]